MSGTLAKCVNQQLCRAHSTWAQNSTTARSPFDPGLSLNHHVARQRARMTQRASAENGRPGYLWVPAAGWPGPRFPPRWARRLVARALAADSQVHALPAALPRLQHHCRTRDHGDTGMTVGLEVTGEVFG